MVSVIDRFNNYCYWADQLRQEPLVMSGWDNSYSLNWTKGVGGSMTMKQPDEIQFRSLLMALRRFVSPKDPVYLNAIYNLCEQHITSDELRHFLRDARQKWKDAARSNGMRFVVNGKEYAPEELANLWINGHYFHGSLDDDKTRELQALQQLQPGFGYGLDRVNFVGYVGDAVRHVLYVDNILRHALRDGCIRV